MPPAVGSGSASSVMLVVSISSEVAGGGGRVSGGGAGAAGGAGGGAGAAGARTSLLVRGDGSSRSRKTRLEVLCLPVFASDDGGGAAAVLPRGMPAAERRGSSPYILRCSASMSRRCSLSGEMSVNSFSAAKACWIFPIRFIRSAYSTKFCLASEMNPLAAYSLASFRRSEEHTSELQSRLHLVCRLLLEKKKNQKHFVSTCQPHDIT